MTCYGQRSRNERKVEILNALTAVREPGWISAPELRFRYRLRIGREALYMRLAAYARWHLVERAQGVAHVLFRMTDKGRERLAWLQSQQPMESI
jgi:hypothetical protein